MEVSKRHCGGVFGCMAPGDDEVDPEYVVEYAQSWGLTGFGGTGVSVRYEDGVDLPLDQT